MCALYGITVAFDSFRNVGLWIVRNINFATVLDIGRIKTRHIHVFKRLVLMATFNEEEHENKITFTASKGYTSSS